MLSLVGRFLAFDEQFRIYASSIRFGKISLICGPSRESWLNQNVFFALFQVSVLFKSLTSQRSIIIAVGYEISKNKNIAKFKCYLKASRV